MFRTHVRKTEYVGIFVEPDLRATIEGVLAFAEALPRATTQARERIRRN